MGCVRRYSLLVASILLLCLWTPASDNSPPVVEVSREAVRPAIRVMEATGYCNCAVCCDTETGITASGKQASMETISADWDVLPEGTWVQIEGIGRRQVQDRGAAIVGDRLDIHMNSHAEALSFGRRTVEVVVENAR